MAEETILLDNQVFDSRQNILSLQNLPIETIVRIFAFLDYKDLLSVSRLNHFFRGVYESFPELQYSFALPVSGAIDRDSSLDIRHKLEELERRERAWRTMDLSRKVTVKVPHRTSHIYDLSGGIYLLGDCKNSIISRNTQTLRFFDLTSCSSGPGIRDEPWSEMKVDANIADIGFGLSEFDLVAVVGIRPGQDGDPGSIIISLRELSTGAPHPLARNPDVIVDPVGDNQRKLSIMLEIVGSRLLLLLTWHQNLQRFGQQRDDKLLLFNWWEGTKIVTECAPQLSWNGFVFLSPELVLLPHLERGLEIIRLPDVSKGYSSKGFERVLRLTLPNLQPSVRTGGIQCRAEPNPFGTPHPSMLPGKLETEFAQRMRSKRHPPVSPDPMKAVVLLQIYYREVNNEPQNFLMGQRGVFRHDVSLVVHREFLLQLVDMFAIKPSILAEDDAGKAEENIEGNMDVDISVPTVLWAQWGPHARWMADDTHVSNWITTSAGQRYVGTDMEGHIVIKDFNPITVRRARAATAGRARNQREASEWQSDGSRSRAAFRFHLMSGSDFTTASDLQGDRLDEQEQQEIEEDLEDSSKSQGTASTNRTSSSPVRRDATWKSVRVIEGYNEVEEIELRQLFSEECKWPLPCVEYISRETYDHHGLLLDEERIIGLRHDENTGAVVEFDVFML